MASMEWCDELGCSSSPFSSRKVKAANAASTVLSNMFQYKKLHKTYKEVRKQQKWDLETRENVLLSILS